MPSPEKRTFSLPTEQAGYIDSLVASGSFASGSEVVRAGLRALQERDAAVEKWLHEEVIGVCDAIWADPGRAIPAAQVFATIRARASGPRKEEALREPQGLNSVLKPLGDLIDLYDYIAVRDGAERAIGYIDRIEDCCRTLSVFPDRGTRRDDLRPGLRILYGGRDLETIFSLIRVSGLNRR